VNPEASGSPRAEVLSELRGLRARLAHVEGSVVATTDGMVIAHDLGASETYGVEPEGVAALSAVNLGLSQRIVDTASHGDLQETIIRGAFGQVVTYAAGERALLTVLIRSTADLGGLHAVAREVAGRVATLLTGAWESDAATWQRLP
jgi:predicted regulator of Ras-like GTPase activity (Roadblock/LC7/MglB family)